MLATDNGRSGRLATVAEAGADSRRLAGLSPVSFNGEGARLPGSFNGVVRVRLNAAAMNFNAVGGRSTVRDGCEPSRLVLDVCSTNATSDKATF